MADCGSCQSFLKSKNDKFSGGFCTFHDARTDTDNGHDCPYHKRIPYNKKNRSKLIDMKAEGYES